MEQLSESKLQLSLFQLYHNERGVNALVESLTEKQEAVSVKKSVVEEWEQTVKAQKKEHGRLNRELLKLEKEIKYAYFINLPKNTTLLSGMVWIKVQIFIGQIR